MQGDDGCQCHWGSDPVTRGAYDEFINISWLMHHAAGVYWIKAGMYIWVTLLLAGSFNFAYARPLFPIAAHLDQFTRTSSFLPVETRKRQPLSLESRTLQHVSFARFYRFWFSEIDILTLRKTRRRPAAASTLTLSEFFDWCIASRNAFLPGSRRFRYTRW